MTLREWLYDRWCSVNDDRYEDLFEEWFAGISAQQRAWYVKQMLHSKEWKSK